MVTYKLVLMGIIYNGYNFKKMILTKDFISQISHVEYYSKEKFIGRTSYIKIHFKKWWKLRKVIKFDWICVEHKGDTLHFTEPDSVMETLNALNNAIKEYERTTS